MLRKLEPSAQIFLLSMGLNLLNACAWQRVPMGATSANIPPEIQAAIAQGQQCQRLAYLSAAGQTPKACRQPELAREFATLRLRYADNLAAVQWLDSLADFD